MCQALLPPRALPLFHRRPRVPTAENCHFFFPGVGRRSPRSTTEMGKTRPLRRVPHKKPPKRAGSNRRGFSKTGLAKYLKTNSHLYGPLAAGSPSDLSPSKTLHSFDTGVKGKEPSKGKEKRLLEKIVEYLMSDSYMYASLVDGGSISPAPASGTVCQVGNVMVAASRTVMSVKEVIGHQLPEDSVPELTAPERHGLVNKEVVKQTVYHNCRRSTSGGTERMSRELRRLVG